VTTVAAGRRPFADSGSGVAPLLSGARRRSKRLLPVLAHRRQVYRPTGAMVEQIEELHHRIDLVVIFGHREARDFGLESLEPGRADGQVDALALDLGRLGDGPFNFAERGVVAA
jgi:hypothetical protein